MESERGADRAAGSHGYGVQSFDAVGGRTSGAHGEGRTDVEHGRDGRPDRDARPVPQHGEDERALFIDPIRVSFLGRASIICPLTIKVQFTYGNVYYQELLTLSVA